MQRDQITSLFEYHWATTSRLLGRAGELPDELYHAELEHGPGSIHKLLFHLIAANRGWRYGLETGKQQSGLDIREYPDHDAVGGLLANEIDAWRDYLSTLSDEDINRDVTLMTFRGREHTFPLWKVLVHLILHGMQHHSELASTLSDHDLSPGNIDFIFYSG